MASLNDLPGFGKSQQPKKDNDFDFADFGFGEDEADASGSCG